MSAYRGDDLTPLFTPSPQPSVGYRRGQLLTYTAVNARNTVDVDGVTLTNLSILNTAGLAAGQYVAILTIGAAAGSWLILGRITTPT